jgi:excisionase family DNA binding protein
LRYALHTNNSPKEVSDPRVLWTFSPVCGVAAVKGWYDARVSAERALNMADAREVMNIRQASQYLGVSPDTLYKYVNEQKIPAFKLGNRWRFKKSKLDQWMEEKSAEIGAGSKKKTKAAGAASSQ